MGTYLLAGLASFLSVFLRGFQQKNISGNHYWFAAGLSYLMTGAEFLVFGMLVRNSWWVILPCGTGGAIGITLSMYVHSRFVKPKNKE